MAENQPNTADQVVVESGGCKAVRSMAKGGLLGYLARNRHFDFRADHLPSSETGRHASEV